MRQRETDRNRQTDRDTANAATYLTSSTAHDPIVVHINRLISENAANEVIFY